jgi:predicted membrane protein (TIGR00267 family)
MNPLGWLLKPQHRLDLVAGLCDGILTALTLAAGKLLSANDPISIGLALRVATAAAVSGGFILFVAHYAELRGELVQAERQLNLLSRGHLATTRLGRAVLSEAVTGALIAAGCSFCGALLPLLVGAFLPGIPWFAIGVALGALAVLGGALGKVVYGSPLGWSIALLLGGLVLSYVGMRLKIL